MTRLPSGVKMVWSPNADGTPLRGVGDALRSCLRTRELGPTIDRELGPGEHTSISDARDNVHWHHALTEGLLLDVVRAKVVADGRETTTHSIRRRHVRPTAASVPGEFRRLTKRFAFTARERDRARARAPGVRGSLRPCTCTRPRCRRSCSGRHNARCTSRRCIRIGTSRSRRRSGCTSRDCSSPCSCCPTRMSARTSWRCIRGRTICRRHRCTKHFRRSASCSSNRRRFLRRRS
jgi:hypothetical protein